GENILKISGMDNLSIMSCGHKLPNIVEILNSDYMKVAIEELKKEYEVIIFDSTPILATADASMIADKIDYTILVYEVNKVARLALKRTVTQLSHINANILGLILNKMKAEDFEPEASYYYSYKYHSPKKTNKVM
ncbi:MAG: hypothetical protein HY769_02245, partial [Candidatus Stahlbacteria bacterium]|nr:hypothetical protein [Candidatus Stahlbacteria bacterium]